MWRVTCYNHHTGQDWNSIRICLKDLFQMHVLSWQIWCVHEPPTSMHIPTLKPWLKVRYWPCGLQLFPSSVIVDYLHLACFHSSCYFVCCLDMLSHFTWFDTRIIYYTVGNWIRSHMRSGLLFPQWIRLPDHLVAPIVLVLHVLDHCSTICVLCKHGVAKMLS